MSLVRHLLTFASAAAVAATAAACSSPSTEAARNAPAQSVGTSGAQDENDCTPSETRAANAPDQKPAFTGQTRACAAPSSTRFNVTVLARGLENPWAVEPLPTGELLVTEKPGRMRIISATGEMGQPLTGLPKVDSRGQGGLLDVALSPNFERERMIYWSFSEPRQGGNATAVARGTLSQDRTRLENVATIFHAMPTYDGDKHFGSRLAFGPDGKLYVSLGERSDKPMRPQAQQLNSHMGKLLRINPDGSAPEDNPFTGQQNAMPEIWTLGHRNVQSLAFDANGTLWAVEHGTRGGDELNRIEKGRNYGWPLVAFGIEYTGEPIPGTVTDKPEYERPVYYWDPVIAPSGAQFYTGSAFPEWRNNLFVGGLKDRFLVRLVLEGNRVAGEERLLADRKQRVRDVRQGPDGALYVVTDEAPGELWKIAP